MDFQEDGREIVVPLPLNSIIVVSVSFLALLGADALFMVVDAFRASFKTYPSLFLPALAAAIAAMVPAPICIFYRCHARLVLSEAGLRWRFWGDWRRTSWDGVQDYFDAPPGSSTGAKLMTIRTDLGDVLLSGSGNKNEAVRHWVQARAAHAAARNWGVEGERSFAADTRTFRYEQKQLWNLLLIIFGILLPMAGFYWHGILRSAPRDFAGAWHPGHLWSSLVAVALHGLFLLFALLLFSLPLLVFLCFLPDALDAWKRRKEWITVRENKITFEDSKRQVQADWSEVTGNFFQPSRRGRWVHVLNWVHVVETKHGSFEYTAEIADNKQLGKIIAARAMPIEERDAPPVLAEGVDEGV